MRHGLFRHKVRAIQRPLLESPHWEYIEGVEISNCWGCGQKTNRVDLSWGAHICSVGCRQIADVRATADLVKLDKHRTPDPNGPEDTWWDDYDQPQFWEV